MRAMNVRALKTVAVVSAAAMVLAACGGGTNGGGGGGTEPAGEIDTNAVLRLTAAAPSRNLDPYLQTSYGGWGWMTPIYDRLTMIDENDEIVPGLAESWEFTNDGSVLELKLRDDVEFNDGTSFDAEAVAANIERGKTMDGSTVVEELSNITSVDVVDPTTLRLNLNEGTGAALPSKFSTHVGMMISPAVIDAGTDIQNDPGDAGSGAYVVSNYVPQESLELVRGENEYWDEEGGRLGGIEVTFMPDASTRLNGMRTGETDLTWVSSANEIVEAQNLAERGAFNVNEVEFRNVLGLMMRPEGALADAKVREGIARAIDPAAISALFSDTCTPYRQLEPESSWAADSNYEYPYMYDEAKAKEQVSNAGGGTVSLAFGAGTNTEKPANVIQSELAAVGLDAELEPVPIAQSEPRYLAGELQSMVTNSFRPMFDPAESVDTFVTGAYNFGNDNPEITDLSEKAEDPSLSQDERAKLYKQIWSKTLEEALFVPICHQANATIANDKVVGVQDIPWVNLGIFDVRTAAMVK